MFTYFFWCMFWHGFWKIFSLKSQKNKTWKSVFWYVNNSVSWGSPCPQNCKDVSNNSMKNIDFSVKNWWKIIEQAGCSILPSKYRENDCPATPICPQNQFLGWFLGPRGDPKMVKNLRGIPNFCVLEAIWEPFGDFSRFCLHLGVILVPSWANFELIFDIRPPPLVGYRACEITLTKHQITSDYCF